jgi:membrane protein required for colicin V production
VTGLSPFDLAILVVVALSGLMGLMRGAVREIITALALIGALGAAVLSFGVVGRAAERFITPPWVAHVAAGMACFTLFYVLIRAIGGPISRGVREAGLSELDHFFGLCLGLARGAVVIGCLALAVNAAVPVDRRPDWMTKAKAYPGFVLAGETMGAWLPSGAQWLKRLRAPIGHADAPTARTTDK